MQVSADPVISRRYDILQQIGQGGMGRVYRAHDRLTGDIVALKHVRIKAGKRESTSTSSDPRMSIAREFQTLASLRHPNIISVIDYGFDDERQPFFTMALLDNPRSIVEAAADQDDQQKVNLLVQVLQALAYLHRRGITHRDLKPTNVLVTKGNQIKVVDFGLAVEKGQADDTAGTLLYMAPEVLRQDSASPVSDLYAVGVIGYEIFVGRHPYDTSNIVDLLKHILESTPDLSLLPELATAGDGDGPSLSLIIGRLLSPHPHQRYQDAYAVIEDLTRAAGLPMPQETVPIRESFLQAAQFVGRDTELDILETALANAIDGRGSAWLIGGESGVGKTRLADELRIRALVRGALVLRGYGSDGGRLPYQLWREPLRMLALSTPVSDLDAGILKEVIPDIDTLLGRAIAPAPPTERPSSQQRLIRTIAHVFRQQSRPVVLLMEDLQWVNASLLPLQQLIQIVNELPLLIIGSYRDDERPTLPDELPGVQQIKLNRLPKECIAKLSESFLGEAGRQQHVIDLLQRETEGNVFFLVEVVRALAEDAGRLTDIGRQTLPSHVFAGGVYQVVKSRLNRVPHYYLPLLNVAAVAGREINGRILHEIDPRIDLEDWITACANASVLTVIDGKWVFSHDKIRESILFEIPGDEITRLHGQVARAIEGLYSNLDEWVIKLAYHYDFAGIPDKAAYYAAVAGEQNLARSVYNEAVSLFERALSYSGMLEPAQEAALKWNLGSAQWGIGRYDTAETLFRESLDLYRQVGDQRGIAEALMGLGDVTRRRGAFEEARTYFQETLALSREAGDQIGMGQAMGRLGVIARNLGDYAEAEAQYQSALAIFEQAQELSRVAGIRSGLGLIAIDQGRYAEARAHYMASLELSRKVGNRTGTALILTGLGWATYMEGNYEDAREHTEESLAISREVGDQWMIANNLGNLGKIHLGLGDAVTAERHFREALGIALAINTPPLMLEILPGIAQVVMQRGENTYAVSLLALSLHHPASYNEIEYQAQPLLDQLRSELPASAYEAAVERGQAFDLVETVQQILLKMG